VHQQFLLVIVEVVDLDGVLSFESKHDTPVSTDINGPESSQPSLELMKP
jgi:hypothetical protein